MKLYHGTSKARLPSILKYGLIADYDISRGHVYFAKRFEEAQTWSVQWQSPVILEFNIPKKMVKEEVGFYIIPVSVSSKYLKKIWVFDRKKIKWVNIF